MGSNTPFLLSLLNLELLWELEFLACFSENDLKNLW
jgi:hypothetical protein